MPDTPKLTRETAQRLFFAQLKDFRRSIRQHFRVCEALLLLHLELLPQLQGRADFQSHIDQCCELLKKLKHPRRTQTNK